MVSIQPPIEWIPGALSLGVMRTGRESDHSPLSGDEVKNEWSYTSTTSVRLHCVVNEAQGQLYLYLTKTTKQTDRT